MTRAVAPPSGWPAPQTAALAGRSIALVPLAEAVADRYFAEFPEDLERYGDAARAWEVHDTLHCLHWAVLDVEGTASLEREVAWLTNVLRSRGFPRPPRPQPRVGGGRGRGAGRAVGGRPPPRLRRGRPKRLSALRAKSQG